RDLALAAQRLDPQHEPSARTAMKAFALEGRRALALETFERLTEALAGIGIQPDALTRVLAERIRTERIHPGAPSAEAAESPVVLAGRARAQLARLSGLWAQVVRGSARAAVILGEPGTG